jgi:hypothetical protein
LSKWLKDLESWPSRSSAEGPESSRGRRKGLESAVGAPSNKEAESPRLKLRKDLEFAGGAASTEDPEWPRFKWPKDLKSATGSSSIEDPELKLQKILEIAVGAAFFEDSKSLKSTTDAAEEGKRADDSCVTS